MSAKKQVQSIFDADPEGGFPLRGDPYLWNILRAKMRGWDKPTEVSPFAQIESQHEQLDSSLRFFYEKLTGKALDTDDGTEEQYDKWQFLAEITGGMSGGCFDRNWWRGKGRRILHERLETLVGDCCEISRPRLCRLLVLKADLLKRREDAIVNPTNSQLLSENGLSGAIFKAGGEELVKACRSVPKDASGDRCSVGSAVVTSAGKLPNRYVIHTVGPNCQRGVTDSDRADLRDCYLKCISLAIGKGIETIAIPSIATGKNAFPLNEAAKLMAGVLVRQCFCAGLKKIVFCCSDDETVAAYRSACREEYKGYSN